MHPDPADILSPEGPIARRLAEGTGGAAAGGFEARPEQIEMARAVASALEDRRTLLVEAGTGVGKSYAYLIPAILRCMVHGERVVVATNTIALQEQLIHKDLPMLQSTLGGWGFGPDAAGLSPVLVKGRGNYLSIRRLKQASARQDRLFSEAAQRRSLHVIEDWAYGTTDGTLSTLPTLERDSVWDHVQSDSDNCMGRKCPHHKECFYQEARRRIEQANLLVCNHALFFADLALRVRHGGILPEYQHVILDEAHNVEDVASEHLGFSLTQGRVHHLLRTLYDARRRKGYLEQVSLLCSDTELVDGAIRLVLNADEASREYFDGWHALLEEGRLRSGRVGEPNLVENTLSPAMRDLATRLRRIREVVASEPDQFELSAYSRRAADIAEAAEQFTEQQMEDFVYWVEVGSSAGFRGRPRVTLALAPIEVGPFLREHLFGPEMGVVLTSATLATRGGEDAGRDAFSHVMSRVGCDDAETLLLGSPFDHAAQVSLIIEPDMPNPRGGSGPFNRALADRVSHHVTQTDGGAFVLFTSFATLNAVADLIRPRLEALGLPMLVQGRDGPRSVILQRFREDERSVLLGAASFWQGVDVRGRGLRNVIITRLPFEPPDRPLTQARLDRIKDRGGDPFREDSLPRAVIRFKQGFGRLIRSHADSGRVVVLDPRIMTTHYGRVFLRSLPAGVQIRNQRAAADEFPPAITHTESEYN